MQTDAVLIQTRVPKKARDVLSKLAKRKGVSVAALLRMTIIGLAAGYHTRERMRRAKRRPPRRPL